MHLLLSTRGPQGYEDRQYTENPWHLIKNDIKLSLLLQPD
jgi:hypothetical protein